MFVFPFAKLNKKQQRKLGFLFCFFKVFNHFSKCFIYSSQLYTPFSEKN